MSNKTEVKIFNQTFDISSSRLSNEELKALAQFVDQRMRTTFKATNLSSALKVAVLTALNLAEELQYKNTLENSDIPSLEIVEKIIKISHCIDTLSESIEDLNYES